MITTATLCLGCETSLPHKERLFVPPFHFSHLWLTKHFRNEENAVFSYVSSVIKTWTSKTLCLNTVCPINRFCPVVLDMVRMPCSPPSHVASDFQLKPDVGNASPEVLKRFKRKVYLQS